MTTNSRRTVITAKNLSHISFLTPLLTFLSAGLTKLVHWDIGFWGILLLIGYSGVGFLLMAIPQKSRTWTVLPETSWATIKQTIATLRALVTVALIAFPIAILSTSKDFLDQLPRSFSEYITHVTADPDRTKSILKLRIEQIPPRASAATYAGTLVIENGPMPRNGDGSAHQTVKLDIPAELYVMNTSAIIEDITDHEILPFFYSIAVAALALSSVFVFAIFFMEIFSDLLRETHSRKSEGG